jgi:hypothetical protein
MLIDSSLHASEDIAFPVETDRDRHAKRADLTDRFGDGEGTVLLFSVPL